MSDNRNGDFLYSDPERQSERSLWFRKALPEIPVTPATLLEYQGHSSASAGWLGVRQIGSPAAQELGFAVWIISGLLLIVWGVPYKARAIILINIVNVVMAASAFAALV